jgi:DNA-binding MarR family transcriptional regulator
MDRAALLASAPMSRLEDLRLVEEAITRIGRISTGREAARIRAERAGLTLSRPAISILASLRKAGPVRLSSLARLTDLEAPLISREIRELVAAGYVDRDPDPTDGRAGIVALTPAGDAAYQAYRAATDAIVAETFTEWSAGDLRTLRILLERVATDFARPPVARNGRRTRVS